VATAVGVSVGRDGFAGGVSVGGGSGVAVETKGGVGACGEQEEMRKSKRKEERMRVVMYWGMESILTELSIITILVLTKNSPARFLTEEFYFS
jgi:hypothetical protein